MGAVVTLHTPEFAWIGRPCADAMRAAFPIVIEHTGLLDTSRHPSWNKLIAIELALQDHEQVLWLDADCLVHRPFAWQEDLGDHWEPLLVGSDWNGACLAYIAARREAIPVLRAMLLCGDVRDDSQYGPGGCKWEQNALKALRLAFPAVDAKVGRAANWVTDHPEADPALHFPVHHYGGAKNKELFHARLQPVG